MSNWIITPQKKNNPKIRLFCLPYAGSSSVVTYKYLIDSIPSEVEVSLVEFPGRGSRMGEELISDINSVIVQLSDCLLDYQDVPFALLGHSMGALTAYELTKNFQLNNLILPYKLYISAHRPPQLERGGKMIYTLNDDEFLDELVLMNGIDKELLKHDELVELFLPIIRNDYKLCETYKFNNCDKVNIPFHIFSGTNDNYVDKNKLHLWKQLTNSSLTIDLIDGDHFFILKNKKSFLEKLNYQLNLDLVKYA